MFRQPHKLCVVWTRHGRRLCSEVQTWESLVDDPYRGIISWSVPENITTTMTLFHSGKVAKCEDKKWMFIVENVSKLMLLQCEILCEWFCLLKFCLTIQKFVTCVLCDKILHWILGPLNHYICFVSLSEIRLEIFEYCSKFDISVALSVTYEICTLEVGYNAPFTIKGIKDSAGAIPYYTLSLYLHTQLQQTAGRLACKGVITTLYTSCCLMRQCIIFQLAVKWSCKHCW